MGEVILASGQFDPGVVGVGDSAFVIIVCAVVFGLIMGLGGKKRGS